LSEAIELSGTVLTQNKVFKVLDVSSLRSVTQFKTTESGRMMGSGRDMAARAGNSRAVVVNAVFTIRLCALAASSDQRYLAGFLL